MKKTLLKWLAVSALAVASYTAGAQSLSIDPAAKNVGLGDIFKLDITGSGFVDAILGGGFNLSFNPSVLHVNSVSFLPSWEFFTSPGTIDNVAGSITDVSFNTFASPKSGTFNAATIEFTAVGSGNSALSLSDSASFPFGDTVGNPVTVSFAGANVAVAAVPEASELSMMLAGLGLVGTMVHRRKI